MENKPLVVALSLFGIGLLAAAMVGVVYVAKLEDLQRRQAQPSSDWAALKRFEGRVVETAGVAFTVHKVYVGEEVNPVIRDPVRAACQDEIVFRIKARNLKAGEVTITPATFRLQATLKDATRQNHRQGFDQAKVATGEERTYMVGFSSLTNTLPCLLRIEGETLRTGDAPEGESFSGVIDVCPAIF